VEPRFDFQTEWPDIARRLDGLLARCRVAAPLRDDLVQETALRLLHMQDRIDPSRSVAALATKIAMNLLRDHIRKERRLVPMFDLSIVGEIDDVESQVVARDEWRRVSEAIAKLKPAQRSALLLSSGLAAAPARVSPAGIRVLRLRARRQLRMILDAAERGRDACGIAVQQVWISLPLPRRATFHPIHGQQAAGVGLALVLAVAVSLGGISSIPWPSTLRPVAPEGESGVPRIAGLASELSGWQVDESARMEALATIHSAQQRAKQRARNVKHRIPLVGRGYIEGDDDEVIGIAAEKLNETKRQLRQPTTLVKRLKEACVVTLGSCDRRRRP